VPDWLYNFNPRFVLEAIPEILGIKRDHYEMLRAAFPGIQIRSVTSGFPSSELGVGIFHPAFPHEINKVWEVVESKPSEATQLLWALGLIPIPVGDHWSFVLDVLFCGVTLAALRYHRATNTPFWKIDRLVRKLLGPNPLRAHDAIGAKGANYLTWSCLQHLSQKYGKLFEPTPELVERKDGGQNWYLERPTLGWSIDDEEYEQFRIWILGAMIQMTSLLLKEKRAHLSLMNAIGELCAQFRRGILAIIRESGPLVREAVQAYHQLQPQAAKSCWYPEVFEEMDTPEWCMLYVNAEHNGEVGVITISRESLNWDVMNELNLAINWLKNEGIERVILTSDFHLSTQMVGADISEFFSALEDANKGFCLSRRWSEIARRLMEEFEVSVGFISGKRCLGGFLELMLHCHFVVSVENAQLGFPEVTLPVVPGMEACHLPFRRVKKDYWQHILMLLLSGKSIKARDGVHWLIDYAGPMEEALKTAWLIATGGNHNIPRRLLEKDPFPKFPKAVPGLLKTPAREAIMGCVQSCCSAELGYALELQARLSGKFMTTNDCCRGEIGKARDRVMKV